MNIYKNEPVAIQLILMDLNMPGMDGKESSSQIREFESALNIEPRVYIVGVTGYEVNSSIFKKKYSY